MCACACVRSRAHVPSRTCIVGLLCVDELALDFFLLLFKKKKNFFIQLKCFTFAAYPLPSPTRRLTDWCVMMKPRAQNDGLTYPYGT